jgi:uncharacterized protein YndB with AHSA1/START domain
MRVFVCSLAALLGCSAAVAEVTAIAPQGFESRHAVVVELSPQVAYQRFIAIEGWWAGSHTYSGDARRLSLDARAGGCWCERLDGGSVEHMRVVYVDAGKAIRFEGGLGPLQELGVRGALTVTFTPAGAGSRVAMLYRVGGWRDTGFADLAPLVDAVLAEQFKSFAAATPR